MQTGRGVALVRPFLAFADPSVPIVRPNDVVGMRWRHFEEHDIIDRFNPMDAAWENGECAAHRWLEHFSIDMETNTPR